MTCIMKMQKTLVGAPPDSTITLCKTNSLPPEKWYLGDEFLSFWVLGLYIFLGALVLVLGRVDM